MPRDLGGWGGSQSGVSVGEEAGERLPQAADGLSFHLVLAKAGPGRGWLWKVEGIGQRLGFVELGVRGSPGSGGGSGWRHILAGFLGQLWFGRASSRAWAARSRLLCGGRPTAGHGACLAGLACGARRSRRLLGRTLALLTTRRHPGGLWRSLTRDRSLTCSLWRARLALGRRGGGWSSCWRSSRRWPGLATLTLGHRLGLGSRLLGR